MQTSFMPRLSCARSVGRSVSEITAHFFWPDANLKPVASCPSHDSHTLKTNRVAYSAQLTVNLTARAAYEVQETPENIQEDIFGIGLKRRQTKKKKNLM